MRYTKIAADTFEKIQLNAGVLLSAFTPGTGAVDDSAILGATSGGINFTDAPEFADFGDDIDNCPKNTKELKKLTGRTVTISGTFTVVDAALAKRLAGAADLASNKITPRSDLLDADFADLWLVGDYSDKNGPTHGGSVAVHMLNALSTGGFQWQTTDREKGKFAFTFTGHYSINNPDVQPYEIYVQAGTAET